jgi:hypothetical protein
MKIGTDISLAECRDSGYMVIEFKKRELIKKGVLQKDVYVECSQSWAFDDRWQNGRPMIGYSRHELYATYDVWHSWETILEMFEMNEQSIMEMCGATCRDDYYVNFDHPNEYDLLTLISDVNSYGGLE